MRRMAKTGLALLTVALVGAGVALERFLAYGISARDQPTSMEAFCARQLRRLAIPRSARDARSPLAPALPALARARAHFADHCASCHGNDGRGKTMIGRNLYPKAPDMTLPDTQNLSDGEIFSIIENGVRLTGMPAWGQGSEADRAQTWELVHFIRHLPTITPEEVTEMGAMNPRSREEWEQEEAERKFLEGGAAPTSHSNH